MMKQNSVPAMTQKGFTLLELLLVVGLLGMLLAGVYQMFDGWMQRAVNRTAAADMLRVQLAADDYVLANFETFKKDAPNIFQEISIADLKTYNYLPTGYRAMNAFKQPIRVFRRNLRVTKIDSAGAPVIDSSGSIVLITTIEVLTLSDNPSGSTIRIGNKRLMDTAQAGGPRMGIVSQNVLAGSTFSGRVSSVFNQWYVQLSDLGPAGYTATADPLGGYLAAYDRVNSEATDANSAYLYRVGIDGQPELNRMQTQLSMNAHPIENVGTVVADKVNVTGNAAFLGQAQGVAAESAQAMTLEQALRIDSGGAGLESRVNMKVTSGACSFAPAGGNNRTIVGGGCHIAGGEIQVISADGNATMGVGTLTADGSMVTDITTDSGVLNAKGISNYISFSGTNMTASDSVVVPRTNVTGGIVQSTEMQTADMSVSNGAIIGAQPRGAGMNNQLVAARVQPNGWDVSSAGLDIGNTAELNGNIYAQGITSSDTMYIENATGSYNDAPLGRTIVCTVYGGRSYCEPSGWTNWPNGIHEYCYNGGANYYRCDHYNASYSYIGSCNHFRSTGASGQAYHASSCS